MEKSLSRKERRQMEEQRTFYRNMKKRAAVLGTTVTAVSAVAPLSPVITVLADESATYIEQTTPSEAVQTTNSAFVDPQTFINIIAQQAKSVADANDLYVSVMIAQAIIESGWGSSTLSKAPNYNLFGIKGSYNGQTVYMSTLEYLNGQWVTKNEPFKKYPSFAESFADNAATLRNVSFQSGVYYYSGAWKSNTKSYRDATAWLTGRYATDPNYASKLNSIIEMYRLTRFDSPATGNNNNQTNTGKGNQVINTGTGSGSNTGSSTDTARTYTVKSGDSIWLIANNHGISMDQLRSWNNLKSDLIHPNQKLIVSQASGTSTGTTTKPVTATNTNVGTTTKPTTPTNTNNDSNSSNATTTTAKTYTVKSGDSVWLIANKHGITIDQLRNWNNLKSDLIHPNQTLKVSNASTSSNTVTTKPVVNQTTAQTTTNTSNEKSHKVVSGDSLWMLSQKYNLSIAQLKTLNSLTSDTIYVGQTLKVR